MLVGGIVLIVVNLLIAKYMHKDAIKRDIKNSEFWLIMGFFLSVIGLLLYIFVRKNYEERK
jgi:Na+/melibiose symporter-like transporter